jgi:hypothetical protein
MTTWHEFTALAPRITEIFLRRHAVARNLCMLATLRADGSPRISPMEPRIFEGELFIAGMPETKKFADLHRDPRFCLHTATMDTEVSDGDAKLFGTVRNVPDEALHQRFAQDVYDDIGLDLRGEKWEYLFAADLTGASAVEVKDGHMDVTVWKPGQPEHVVRKH